MPSCFKASARQKWIFSFSVAMMLFAPFWMVITKNAHSPTYYRFLAQYYHGYSLTDHIDLFALLILIALSMLAVRLLLSLDGQKIAIRWSLCVICIIALIGFLNSIRTTYLQLLSIDAISSNPVLSTIGIIFLSGTGLLIIKRPAALAEGLTLIVLMMAPVGVLALAHMTLSIYRFAPEESLQEILVLDNRLVPLNENTGTKINRVFVLIFDQWEGEEIFESPRPPYVSLANLDQLKSESFYGSLTLRAGFHTNTAMPSMVAGRQGYINLPDWKVEGQLWPDTKIANGLDLLISFDGMKTPVKWSKQPNIFRDVRSLGGNVAYLGTPYHPYCKLFNDAISSCLGGGFDKSIRKTPLNQIWNVLVETAHGYPGVRKYFVAKDVTLHDLPKANNFLKQLSRLKQLAADDRISLIFAHFMLPHRLFFYDAQTNEFRSDDALVNDPEYQGEAGVVRLRQGHSELIDLIVKGLRGVLNKNKTWDETTIILSADHGRITDGAKSLKEMRVPLIVKPGWPTKPQEFDQLLYAYRYRQLVKEIMTSKFPEGPDIAKILGQDNVQSD